jgi:hypothetical protein
MGNHSGSTSQISSFPILQGKIPTNPQQREKLINAALKESSFDKSSSEDEDDDACFDENNPRMCLNDSSIYEGVDRLKNMNQSHYRMGSGGGSRADQINS